MCIYIYIYNYIYIYIYIPVLGLFNPSSYQCLGWGRRARAVGGLPGTAARAPGPRSWPQAQTLGPSPGICMVKDC